MLVVSLAQKRQSSDRPRIPTAFCDGRLTVSRKIRQMTSPDSNDSNLVDRIYFELGSNTANIVLELGRHICAVNISLTVDFLVCTEYYRERGKQMGARFWDDLDMLAAKLQQAEAAHLHALSAGDADDTSKARLRLNAVMAERDRLIRQLSAGLSGD
jgi:hypothetical protein